MGEMGGAEKVLEGEEKSSREVVERDSLTEKVLLGGVLSAKIV